MAVGMITRVDSERRLRLPEEWSEEFPADQDVELVQCDEGVLLRPVRQTALQAALERTFPMNRPSHLDLSDLNMDTLGYEPESEEDA